MAKVRLYNLHTAPIDNVPPGAQGEFDDCPGVRGMFERGLLSMDAPRSDEEPTDLQARVAELEKENASLRRANAEGSALVASLQARVAELSAKKPKKGEEPPAEG